MGSDEIKTSESVLYHFLPLYRALRTYVDEHFQSKTKSLTSPRHRRDSVVDHNKSLATRARSDLQTI